MNFDLRIAAILSCGLALASCSGAQNASFPSQQSAASAPASSDSTPGNANRHGIKPNDTVGGGGMHGEASMQVNIEDVGLPNGSTVQAINLGIDRVFVTDALGNVTTVAQYASPQVVNVLAYQGGNTTPIGQGNVAAIIYASMTIVVDTGSSNYVNGAGNARPLSFSSQSWTRSSSGFGASTTTSPGPVPGSVAITFNKPFQVVGSGINVDVDFNAMESFLPQSTSSGAVSRPSLTVAQRGYEGTITGTVTNQSGSPVSNAVVVANGTDGADATTFTDQNGNFLMHTLYAGSYQLTVFNRYTSASGWSISAQNNSYSSGPPILGPVLQVSPGQNSNAGNIAD